MSAIVALEQASFAGDRLSGRSVRRLLPQLWVLDGAIAGRLDGYLLVLTPARHRTARLYAIAVAPQSRGRGLGRLLLGAAEAIARDAGRDTLILEVRPDNHAARQLYASAGYLPFGTYDAFYEDGAPALRLRRSLQLAPRRVVLVDHPDDAAAWPGAVPVRRWLAQPDEGPVILWNACRDLGYLSAGYYASLLAEAQGHTPWPPAATLLDWTSGPDRTVRGEPVPPAERWTGVVRLLLGRPVVPTPDALRAARRLASLAVPALDAWCDPDGRVQVSAVPLAALRPDERRALADAPPPPAPVPPAPRRGRRLGLLSDPSAMLAPSDPAALQRFDAAAREQGFEVVRLTPADLPRLAGLDALLLRDSTHPQHHTYAFARTAERLGLAVIDDAASIRCCGNKVYQAELFRLRAVPRPKTRVTDRRGLRRAAAALGYPLVLKAPDGFSSRGVHRVRDADELIAVGAALLARSHLIVLQAFVPSAYDWRVGVVGRQPVFACRYWMCGEHWQVVSYDADGRFQEGAHDTLAVEDAPPEVIRLAVEAANLFGDGLYGVDLKMTPDGPVVVEVNDAPSIEHGVEDQAAGTTLYRRVVAALVRRWATPDPPSPDPWRSLPP